MSLWFVHEEFTDEERSRLAPYFTNLDGPVFALLNLPEVVKGALFARYSRTGKSLRRLFLDEFAEQVEGAVASGTEGVKVDKAEQLYERVFFDFGDDSVAQLGGVHLACEQVSQLLAKAIEWGRLAAYLEQSTRYMRYDDRPGGRWRLTVPPEISGTPAEGAYLGVRGPHLRDVRPAVPAAVRPVRRAIPEGPRRPGVPLPLDDHGEDL